MAAAMAEAVNENACGGSMQIVKENSSITTSLPDKESSSFDAATATSRQSTYTKTIPSSLLLATGDSDDDDDATMQTPSASPAISFDAGDEFASTTDATGSDFGSGISIATTTTTGSGSLVPQVNTSSGSIGSANTLMSSASSTSIKSVDLDSSSGCALTMPQWKKELIQRRKANIARTIGANQPGICPKKGTSPTTSMATSPVIKHFCNDSNLMRGIINGGTGTDGSQSGVNARTPDIIQSGGDASSGHYTPTVNCSCQQHQPKLQQQLSSCVDGTNSSSGAILLNAKPKTCCTSGSVTGNTANSSAVADTPSSDNSGNSFTGNDGLICGKKYASGGITSSGTCLTTSPQQQTNPPPSSSSLYRHSSQQPQLLQQLDPHSKSNIDQQFQLHSRLDVEHSTESFSSSSESCAIATGTIVVAATPAIVTTTSFIKNPTVNKTTNKFNKYKSSSAKSSTVGSTHVNNNSVSILQTSLQSVNSIQSQSNGNSVSGKKMVAAQELDASNDAFEFDPSEELQYGPGIVSKLRCRYLSLALRQSAAKQRPNLDNLRRATSLNNLLDDDDRGSNSSCTNDQTIAHHNQRPHSENLGKTPDEFVATFQKNLKVCDKQQRSRNIKRGNESLKRARSVEALLVCDKSWENDTNMANTNGIVVQLRHTVQPTIEPKPDISSITSSAEVTIEDKIISARERTSLLDKPPKRISPFMDETERPPPDVVKQTLKIFEATANRRGRGLSRNNCNGEVATKVRNYKSIISQEKPPIIFPKPPLSPKKNFRKPNNLDIVAAKKLQSINKPLTATNGNNGFNSSNGLNNGSSNNNNNNHSKKMQPTSPLANNTKKVVGNSVDIATPNDSIEIQSPKSESKNNSISPPIPSVRTTVPFRHNASKESTPIRSNTGGSGSYDAQSPQTPDIIPRKIFDPTTPNSPVDSPVIQLAKQIERLKIVSPTTNLAAASVIASGQNLQQQRKSSESDEDDDDDSTDGEKLTKRVSKLALENISKAGTTQQFNFSNMKTSNNNKLPLAGSKTATAAAAATTVLNGNNNGLMQSEQQSWVNQTMTPMTTTTMQTSKQIGIIRPLVAEPKLQLQQQQQLLQQQTDNKLKQNNSSSMLMMTNNTNSNNDTIAPDYTSYVDEQTTKTRDNLVISNLSQQQQQQQQSSANSIKSSSCSDNNISSNKPTIVEDLQQQLRPVLTSREIEKNLINAKKNEEANLEANSAASGAKWQFTKKKTRTAQQSLPPSATQNTMVFNFKDRKEVPDYIENDGLLFRRKRELPKPNEPGFVLLGDLSLETSTDPDDEWTMGPPSPCDVEFENANIIIDGKSSIRSKSREISLRVQFDETLTSTFEYPSESSFLEEFYDNANTENTTTLSNHIATASVNSIAPVTNTITATAIAATEEIIKNPGQKLLGSMSLGSAPLANYIPMKAQINSNFELGVTRSTTFNSPVSSSNAVTDSSSSSLADENRKSNNLTGTNGNSTDERNFLINLKSSTPLVAPATTNGSGGTINNYILNGGSNGCSDEPESLQYLKPATDDLTVAYSEGSQKTDLLY